MSLKLKRIEVCQPNPTVAALIRAMIEAQGGEALSELDVSAPCADLLLYDLDCASSSPQAERARLYELASLPTICSGSRAGGEALGPHARWLERPFTMDALRELAGRELAGLAPGEREEAAALEEEFGLEPGVLGGASDEAITPRGEQELLDATGLEEISGSSHHGAISSSEAEQEDEASASARELGGVVYGAPRHERVSLGGVASRRERAALKEGVAPAALDLKPLKESVRDQSSRTTRPRRPAGRQARRARRPAGHEEVASVSGGAEASSLAPPAAPLTEELALEVRSFARMLSEALGTIALNARAEDRFAHIERALSALLTRGLDGASEELRRVPRARGFSGDLRALSLVALFQVIADRALRGKLEIASGEEAYILYVEGARLCEIDALVDNGDRVLLEVIRAEQLLEPGALELIEERYEVFGEPVEMALRRLNRVDASALERALKARAVELFRRACQVRDGRFAFIELSPGDGLAWPVRDLGLDLNAMWLELLRRDAVETSISEATASAQLMPDVARVMAMHEGALTEMEREALEVFEGGASIASALKALAHHDRDAVTEMITHLKRARLLWRVAGSVSLWESSSGLYEALGDESGSSASVAVAREGTTRQVSAAALVQGAAAEARERTVVTELDARELDARSTREGQAAQRSEVSAAFPLIGEEPGGAERGEGGEEDEATLSLQGRGGQGGEREQEPEK